MKNLILTVLVIFASVSTFAGPRIVGNGGIAVEQDGKLYMLDLFERGIHKNPYYAPSAKPLLEVQDVVEKTFSMSDMENVPVKRLTYKLNEVYSKSYLLGLYFTMAISKLDWRLVDAPLSPSEDARTPIDNTILRQVAVRLNTVVYISKEMWDRLDENNKVALILHEAAYFFTQPQGMQEPRFQHAAKARSATGLVFTKRFAVEGITSENSELKIANVTNALKQDRNNFVTNMIFQIGTDEGKVYNELRLSDISDGRSPLKNKITEQELIAEVEKQCARVAANLTKAERAKSTVKLNIGLAWAQIELITEIKEYSLKEGDTQKYLYIWERENTNIGYTSQNPISTKNAEAACVARARTDIKKIMDNFNYEVK